MTTKLKALTKSWKYIKQRVLIKFRRAGGNTLRSGIHKLIVSVRNKEALPQQWKESIIVCIYKKATQLTVIQEISNFIIQCSWRKTEWRTGSWL